MTEYQGSGLRHLRPGVELVRRAYSDPAFEAEGPKAYVASVCDVELRRQLGTLGTYVIPAAQFHIGFSLVEIEPRVERVDIGLGLDGKYGKEFWPARRIAEDVVGAHSYENYEKWGVFICAGEQPTEEELARARARLTKTYQDLVFEGDQLHARPNGFRDITDVHRRAVKYLGQERPWAYTPQQLVPCPGCGERLVPTVAVCKHCGAVLDRKRAEELGIIKAEVGSQTSEVGEDQGPEPVHETLATEMQSPAPYGAGQKTQRKKA